jgi:RHS repeat-associated protein
LSLPITIYFANGGGIEHFYNALGQKVKKSVYDNSNMSLKFIDYLDGFQYAGGKLQFFPHPEGYVNATPTDKLNTGYGYNYVFNYTDHLGNVRLSYTKDPQTNQLKIMEENHYYPFGLKHSVYVHSSKKDFKMSDLGGSLDTPVLEQVTDMKNLYRYNSKEWQDELGLNMYDMDLRQYDPAIARWVVQDPVTHFDYSPYNAFDNNPVFWADPSGADAVNIGYDRMVDSQDLMGSVHWSGGFQEIENEGGGESETQKGTPSSSEQRASQDNGDDPPGKGEGLRKFLNTKIGKWGAKLGDMLSGGQVSDMEESLYLYETEGFDSYIYSQIGSATRDARYSMMGQYRGGKVGGATKTGMSVFDIAKAGGRHSGFYKNYVGRSADEINKAINTLQTGKRGINTHLDKIANPSKYVPNWNNLRPSHQQSLINGWQKEINNANEQIQILRGILGK